MTELSRHTPPGGGVRGFYARLGVELPGWSRHEAPVRCFADPDAHARGDRSPSCSVNLASGAWCCHGCGAAGGAYDAALACGHSPRSAIDLMIDFGLATPRRGERAPRTRPPSPPRPSPDRRSPSRARANDGIAATAAEVAAWHEALMSDAALLERLARARAWSVPVLERFEVGSASGAITIPVRDSAGDLVALARYRPPFRRSPRERKLRMLAGSRRALFPSPAAVGGRDVWLVEGHPDALAAHSAAIPALAIPGDWGWDPKWAALFADRDIVVCLDCDAAGRRAAARIVGDLLAPARSVRHLDLDPGCDDGFDLTDALIQRGPGPLLERACVLPAVTDRDRPRPADQEPR